MVEHATENRGVASPILALGTSRPNEKRATLAGIVQLVEHLLAKEKVTGSSPVARSFLLSGSSNRRLSNRRLHKHPGDVAKW